MSVRPILLVLVAALGSTSCQRMEAPAKLSTPALLPGQDAHEDFTNKINATDGFFTIPDRSVTCRIDRGAIACTNPRLGVLCKDDVCRGYPSPAPEAPEILQGDSSGSDVRVIPERTVMYLPRGPTCWIAAAYIECSLADYYGGFQMSGYFGRVQSYDDAPAEWPRIDRKWSIRDRMPGV